MPFYKISMFGEFLWSSPCGHIEKIESQFTLGSAFFHLDSLHSGHEGGDVGTDTEANKAMDICLSSHQNSRLDLKLKESKDRTAKGWCCGHLFYFVFGAL